MYKHSIRYKLSNSYSVLLDKSQLFQVIFQSWKLDYILTFKSLSPVAAPPSLLSLIGNLILIQNKLLTQLQDFDTEKAFDFVVQFHLQFWYDFIVRQIKDFFKKCQLNLLLLFSAYLICLVNKFFIFDANCD